MLFSTLKAKILVFTAGVLLYCRNRTGRSTVHFIICPYRPCHRLPDRLSLNQLLVIYSGSVELKQCRWIERGKIKSSKTAIGEGCYDAGREPMFSFRVKRVEEGRISSVNRFSVVVQVAVGCQVRQVGRGRVRVGI